MRRAIIALLLIGLAACASSRPASYGGGKTNPFLWPKDGLAIPDERTALSVAIAVYQGIMKRDIGDPKEIASHMEAYRYRRSDLERDANGDAWYVHPKDEETARFSALCAGNCFGGLLFNAALAANDGRVLEFYIPQ